MSNTILVTGGAGFIGSNFVHFIRKTRPDLHVVVLDKLTYAANLNNFETINLDGSEGITLAIADISDYTDTSRVFKNYQFEYVINFAAESHVDNSLKNPIPFVRTNVEGVLNLCDLSVKHGVKRFLQVSTDEVYGSWHSEKHGATEDCAFKPRSPYSATKASAEHIVMSYVESFGLDAVITRGCNTYGPYQYPEKIIPVFINKAIENKRMPVYGNGSAKRMYMHATDHCRGIYAALLRGYTGEAYNLGTKKLISAREMAWTILKAFNRPETMIDYVQDRPGHDMLYNIDSYRAELILGWKPTIEFDKGIKETVEWYKKHPNGKSSNIW